MAIKRYTANKDNTITNAFGMDLPHAPLDQTWALLIY